MDISNMSVEEIESELDKLLDAQEYRKIIDLVEKVPKSKWTEKIVRMLAASYNNAEEYQKAIDCLNENKDLCKDTMYRWHYIYAYATYWSKLYQETLEHVLKAFEAAKCDVNNERYNDQLLDMARHSTRMLEKGDNGKYANELYDRLFELHHKLVKEIVTQKIEAANSIKKYQIYVNYKSDLYDYDEEFRSLARTSKEQLSKDELVEVFQLLSDNQCLEAMVSFLEETGLACNLKMAEKCMNFYCHGRFNIDTSNILYKLIDLFLNKLSKSSGEKLIFKVVCLAIEFNAIHLFEQLVNREDFPTFDESQMEKINGKIAKADGRVAREYFEYYFANGTVKNEYGYYYRAGIYRPQITSEEYFKYDAWENCLRCLKDYGKKNLLDPETSKKKLWNFFYSDYNWDDGVDIPYFVLSHPNCDLELKKLLYDLAGCEFITEKTYEKSATDPEMYFLIMLDKMVKAEEAG